MIKCKKTKIKDEIVNELISKKVRYDPFSKFKKRI